MQDLKQAFPELGRGLQSLLDFEGDVESTFLRSFDVEYDYYGELRRHELKPGGSQVAVTNDNRQEYVDLYTKWLLHDSIGNQFAAFAHGFHEVRRSCSFRSWLPVKSWWQIRLLNFGLKHHPAMRSSMLLNAVFGRRQTRQ